MAAKKKKTVSAHDLDRIIVRLPPGMRETLAERATENGRSMTAEVVAALAEHLRRKDRLSALEAKLEAMQSDMNLLVREMANRVRERAFQEGMEKNKPPE